MHTKCFRVAVALLLTAPHFAAAQTAPQIGYLFPAGAQRGTKVEVEVGGKYMPGPCGIRVEGPGVKPSSDTTEGHIEFSIDSNATPGPRAIRIHSIQGGSTPRAFFIGTLPEVLEDSTMKQQVVSPRVTINGRLHPKGDLDEYVIDLEAGQQIVCAVALRKLGSPGDAVLRLIDAAGRTVARGDQRRSLDPLLVWRCQMAGRYVLQIFDLTLSGAADSVYRLTVTDRPYLDYAFPTSLPAGGETNLMLHGWNLPGDELSQRITAAGQSHVATIADSANQLKIPVTASPHGMEHEPNGLTEPQLIVLPQVLHGRFQQPGDVDVFKITANKGEKVVFRIEAERLGFPTDTVLRVLKADGTLIRETDDVRPSRDPDYVFTAPADGDYLVSLHERAGRSGPRFVYRLNVAPPKPSVRLTVKTSEFAVVPGETLSVPVRVTPVDGFTDAITLNAVHLPPGVSVEPVSHTPKKAGDVSVEFTAEASAALQSGTIEIVACPADGESDTVLATTRVASATTLPLESIPLWLTVGPKVPFQLTTVSSIQEAPRLSAFPFPVTVTREEGFSSRIRLVGVDPDRRGTVVPLTGEIAADSDTGSLPLIIQSEAIEGTTHRCRVMGIAEVVGPDGRTHPVFHVAKGSMAMGCQPNLLTLKCTPERLHWRPGQPIRVELSIGRRVDCGDVTVKLLSGSTLPVNVSPVVISSGETRAGMNLVVDPSANLPPSLDLHLQAEAYRNGLPVYARTKLRLVTR